MQYATLRLSSPSTTSNLPLSLPQVKEALSAKTGDPVGQICLIFSGKILKDHEDLGQHGIGDGLTLHLVVRQPKPTRLSSATRLSARRMRP